MELRTGTSGFSYKEWKGPFYPADVPQKRWLAWYAERLRTVEINNTFYRSPRREVVARWAEEVPAGFRFVIKAPKRITHYAKLADVGEPLDRLWDALEPLGERRGPVLFQLPPTFKKDVPRLADFLALLPGDVAPVLEFRHASWRDDEVLEALRAAGAALCVVDSDAEPAPPIDATADFGYVRLRAADYDDRELDAWIERFRAQPWRAVWAFLKHEDEGAAPRLALRLAERFAE